MNIEENQGSAIASPRAPDVGYKRPPVEHQFKKGHKPKPRKQKQLPEPKAALLLWPILREERRVMLDGNPRYVTNAELLLRKAFELADRGNGTMGQLVAELVLAQELAELSRVPETRLFIDGKDVGTIIT